MPEGRFPYGKLVKYPRMGPEDVAIWERFIALNPNYFDTVDYDYNVGRGADLPNPTSDAVVGNYNFLTQKRVDCIGYRANEVTLVEVKPRASLGALGQIIGYRELFVRGNPTVSVDRLMIITDMCDGDMETVAKAQGIQVICVNR